MRTMFSILLAALLGAASGFCQTATNDLLAHTLTATTADSSWAELRGSLHLPEAPAQWSVSPPSDQEKWAYYLPYVLAAADRASNFAQRFPQDSHARDARVIEVNTRNIAVNIGASNQSPRLESVERGLLSDPTLPEDQRFQIRYAQIMREADAAGENGAIPVLQKGARALQKEFPHEPRVYQLLLNVARNLGPDEAKPTLQEVANATNAPDQLREMALSELKMFDRVGKPLELQFTAVDGRPVNLASMKSNVVLVDFWATWCAPCRAELPHVKEAYDKLHSRGFDIVGISLDDDKGKLTSFLSSHQMAWPQYFDGLQWKNKYAQEFAIESVPTMWLVDKHGILRDINARDDLAGKVEKLLAER